MRNSCFTLLVSCFGGGFNHEKEQQPVNTLRTGDADLRFYVTTVQDRWRRFAFL